MWGLGGYFRYKRLCGAGTFEVLDGANRVGDGVLTVWLGDGPHP